MKITGKGTRNLNPTRPLTFETFYVLHAYVYDVMLVHVTGIRCQSDACLIWFEYWAYLRVSCWWERTNILDTKLKYILGLSNSIIQSTLITATKFLRLNRLKVLY